MSKARNGEGSIRPRQTREGTVYDVQLSVRDRRTGLTRRVFKGGFPSQKEAIAWRAKTMQESNTRGLVREKPLTVPEIVLRWMNSSEGKAPTTVKCYDVSYRNHVLPRLNVRVSSLTEDTMRAFVRDVAKAASLHPIGRDGRSTASTAFTLVKTALKWAARRDVGLINYNPLGDMGFPWPTRAARRKAMPMPTVRRLLAAARPESTIIWRLLLETGARRGEIVGLSWYDVDFEEGTVNISVIASPESGGKRLANRTKTHRQRSVPLSGPLLEALREMARGKPFNAPVLVGRNGQRLGFSTMARWWRRDMRAAGLNPDVYSPHCLRHTWATEALNNGVPVKVVSSILGHASAATTLDIYAHATRDQRRAAVDLVASKLTG